MADLGKTLEELDGEVWGEPPYGSHVVTECYRLRRVPLRDLTIEDLRLLIGQKIGLPHLLPLAIDRLEDDPLVSGDFYAGDLMKNVLLVPAELWAEHPALREKLRAIADRFFVAAAALEESWHETCAPNIREAYRRFKGLPEE